jgi:hypothetical protein
MKVCENPKLLEKINKVQLNQEKREDLLPQMYPKNEKWTAIKMN